MSAALAVVVLQGVAIVELSLTMDEPRHLLAGVQIVEHGVNTINLEHPPLVKMVAAVAWWHAEPAPLADPVAADREGIATQELLRHPDVGTLARTSRAVLAVCFALPFLLAAAWLGRVVDGPRTGALLALMLGLSAGVLPYLSLVLTDTAAALGFAVCLAAGAETIRRAPGVWRTPASWMPWAGAVGLGLGIALAAKFSGLLLAPTVVAAAWLAPAGADGGPGDRVRSRARRAAFVGLAGAVALVLLWLSYAVAHRQPEPGAGARAMEIYADGRANLVVEDRLVPWRERLVALHGASPAAAQWLAGFLSVRAQNRIGVYPSYAFGEIRSDGRPWYFPVLLLVRTPLGVLLASFAAGAALAGLLIHRRRETKSGDRRVAWLLGGTAGLYLAFAVAGSYNNGLRHLLPILPVLYLPAAVWASRRPWRTVALVGVLLVEAVALAPYWISSTNTWWLGDANPTRFAFGGSDGDYEQGLRSLAREARERGIERLHVVHPTVTAAELAIDLPRAVKTGPSAGPLEPGWYAVTVLAEQLVPAILAAPADDVYNYPVYRRIADEWWPLLEELNRRGEDHGIVAGVFRLYSVPPAGSPPPQSERSAIIGSTFDARRAGR